MAEEDLSGWEAAEDGEGRIYYFNRFTQETSWEIPAGVTISLHDPDDNHFEESQEGDLMATDEDQGIAEDNIDSASPWCIAIDANSGLSYYFNAETHETTWTRPAELGPEGLDEHDLVLNLFFFLNPSLINCFMNF